MTTNIQLLRSSIEQKRPAASVLLDGQVALNLNFKEPGLFFRLTNGQLAKVGPVAYTNDGLAPNSAASGQPGNSLGELWYDDRISFDNGVMKMWDGVQWQSTSGFTVNDATGDFALDRDITCNILHAKTLDLSESLVLSHDLLSNGDCQHNIGHDLERFNTGYFCTVDVKGSAYINNDVTAYNAIIGNETVTQTLKVIGNANIGSSIAHQLTVSAGSRFEAVVAMDNGLVLKGDTVLGDGLNLCNDNLTVNSVSLFNCDVTFKESVVFEKQPTFTGGLENQLLLGDTVIGDTCATSTLTIKAETTVECDILPDPDSTINLGSPTARFANVYTGDLHLKNDRGDWTMVEEDEYLTLRNNKTGKTFRLVMEEVSG